MQKTEFKQHVQDKIQELQSMPYHGQEFPESSYVVERPDGTEVVKVPIFDDSEFSDYCSNIVRATYVQAAAFGLDKEPPATLMSRDDALYYLRKVSAWLDGQGDKATLPVDGPLTVKQAAAYLNVSPKTIYAACDASTLRHLRIGEGRGTIRIAKSDLDNFTRQSAAAGPKDYLTG